MSGGVIQHTLVLGVLAATPLLWASLGELLSEKVGVGNWGIEGVMLMGSAVGYIVAVDQRSAVLGLLGGGLVAGVFSVVVYGIPTLALRVPPLLSAFATWFIGTGLSAQLGKGHVGVALPSTIGPTPIPGLEHIPLLGPVLFDQPWPLYLGVALTLLVALGLKGTRHGLCMVALGEDPASAYASGIRVLPWRAFYLALGGAMIGVGGAILSIVVVQSWRNGLTAGQGWLAWALVLFVSWRTLSLLWATVLFGVLLSLGSVAQANNWGVPSEVLAMLPYVFTVLVLAVRSAMVLRRGGLGAPGPAALGAEFYRGQA